MACGPFLRSCIEILKFLLCVAGRDAPGAQAFEKQVAIASKCLMLALICAKLRDSKKTDRKASGEHIELVMLNIRHDVILIDGRPRSCRGQKVS